MHSMSLAPIHPRPVLWFVVRVLAALFLFATFLASGGCGSVTLTDDLGAASGDATVDASTAMEVRRPDTSESGSVKQTVPDAGQPESQPPIDAGGALPICPPEIMSYDCPQPKCDCRDR